MTLEQDQIYGITAMLLFCLGLHGVVTRPDALRKIIALNIMGAGVFLFLVSIAKRAEGEFADPVPHAMVLTGIVVAVSASAFGLGLARRLGSPDVEEKDDPPS